MTTLFGQSGAGKSSLMQAGRRVRQPIHPIDQRGCVHLGALGKEKLLDLVQVDQDRLLAPALGKHHRLVERLDPWTRWSRRCAGRRSRAGLMREVRTPGQSASDGAEVEAAYAQIVCRALFQQRAQTASTAQPPLSERAPHVPANGAGGAGVEGAIEAEAILRRYLDATLDELGPLGPDARRLLEDHLVTADGIRTLRTEDELLRNPAARQACADPAGARACRHPACGSAPEQPVLRDRP